MTEQRVDVVIVGAGVTGAAIAWALGYANIQNTVIIEKNPWVGQVNSHPMNNAQTSHDGGTETNYGLAHALEVKACSDMLRAYCVKRNDPLLFQKRLRMALGVVQDEVEMLHKRFMEFAPYYSDLHLAEREELAKLEPKIMEGRDPAKPICALVSTEGYIVNYQRLAECLLEDAMKEAGKNNVRLEALFNTGVKSVSRNGGGFILETDTGMRFYAREVVFAAGAYSLHFAHQLGYGKEYSILSVAGSFFSAGHLLDSKVYRCQIEGLPFAAIHGDPDILNMNDTRFGPTTKPLPLMERYHYETLWDYLKLFLRSPWAVGHGIWSLGKILANRRILSYVSKHFLYDLPVIGKALFLREVRPIIPTIRYKDLKLRRGAGGIRPQIINLAKGEMIMGDVTIEGESCLFVTTPSPGASVSVYNGMRFAKYIVHSLGEDYRFDEERFRKNLGL
ncbi:MAG: FAD-dependent oxidoreductase [bacterium]|nr:FAD-dependent oxidoreductase [bacterium]